MRLHPVDIAKEFRSYQFFKSFNDDLLLRLCTMADTTSIKQGDLILKEGDINTKLYFLRSGQAEIILAGEVVAVLDTPGDVMGDMSVVTERPVTTSIRAATEVECFILDSLHFDSVGSKDRDQLLALFYKVYSVILAERLVKTNEKARLFEIANRELHQAQVALDKLGDHSVLLVEADRKQLVMAKMAVGATGVKLDTASDLESALALAQEHKFDAVICDESHADLLKKLNEANYQTRMVLMTSRGTEKNLPLLQDMLQINNVIARNPDDRSVTVRMLLTTLRKILKDDLFGMDKYLAWGVDIQSESVTSSSQRENLKANMANYLKSLGVRNSIIDRADAACEEILMNAIYDAPTNSQGEALFNHLSRKTEVTLESHQRSLFQYACDGIWVGVSVVDPFGALTKKILLDYLHSCYSGVAGSLNEGKGGAGRGLHQIIEGSDLTIFNIKQRQKTEVICLFNVEGPKFSSEPSFHFFFSE